MSVETRAKADEVRENPAQGSVVSPASSSEREARRGSHAGTEPPSASLFALLWDALADLLGTAAAATLVRRAAKRATAREPTLAELWIVRENLEYRYTVPLTWKEVTPSGTESLKHLVRELVPLLVELTGSLVVNHLAEIPELRQRGLFARQEELP